MLVEFYLSGGAIFGLAGALKVSWNRIFVLVPDIEHRERLINADDLSVFELFRERSRDSTRARRQIEDHLSALERQHLDQLVAQSSANARESALVEFGAVRRIVKAGPVLMAMRVAVR